MRGTDNAWDGIGGDGRCAPRGEKRCEMLVASAQQIGMIPTTVDTVNESEKDDGASQ